MVWMLLVTDSVSVEAALSTSPVKWKVVPAGNGSQGLLIVVLALLKLLGLKLVVVALAGTARASAPSRAPVRAPKTRGWDIAQLLFRSRNRPHVKRRPEVGSSRWFSSGDLSVYESH